MRIPKRYGQSRIENCPFCGKQGVVKNKQGVPVCLKHKDSFLDGLKCVCGEYLDVKAGKWGPYFVCMNCGNINFKKGMGMNPQIKEKTDSKVEEKKCTKCHKSFPTHSHFHSTNNDTTKTCKMCRDYEKKSQK